MQDKFPKYVDDDSLSRIQIRDKLPLQFYSRRRYNWNLTCEKNPKTSSKTFFSAIHDIRYFFYSNEDLRKFSDVEKDHSHDSYDA